MPQVTVIVPVYNNEKYLCCCIDSILGQSFSDFELLIIDDGSTDASGAICDQYAKKDARIKVIHQENAGVSSARNRGIKEAQGTYLMFCDSDDYVHPKWCEMLLDEIIKHPDSFVVCDIQKGESETSFRKELQQDVCKKSDYGNYFDVWKAGLSAYSVNKIYDRKKVIENEINFPKDIAYSEDVVFNVRYYQLCSDAVLIWKKLYYYRDNPTSLMHRKYDDFFPVYVLPFTARLPVISNEKLGEYCDVWLYRFIHMLGHVYEREDMPLRSKLKYNQKIMNSKEFRYCLKNATGKKESTMVLNILRTHNYYVYWLFEQLVKILKGDK